MTRITRDLIQFVHLFCYLVFGAFHLFFDLQFVRAIGRTALRIGVLRLLRQKKATPVQKVIHSHRFLLDFR